MANYIPLKDADITLVSFVDGKPWCKVHGAMNKITADGIWRCVSAYRYDHSTGGKPKLIENICKAGCQEAK